MELEQRYIVIKIEDAIKYLTESEKRHIHNILRVIEAGRSQDNKPVTEYLCIGKDWPEYEPTLQLLSNRVDSEAK